MGSYLTRLVQVPTIFAVISNAIIKGDFTSLPIFGWYRYAGVHQFFSQSRIAAGSANQVTVEEVGGLVGGSQQGPVMSHNLPNFGIFWVMLEDKMKIPRRILVRLGWVGVTMKIVIGSQEVGPWEESGLVSHSGKCIPVISSIYEGIQDDCREMIIWDEVRANFYGL